MALGEIGEELSKNTTDFAPKHRGRGSNIYQGKLYPQNKDGVGGRNFHFRCLIQGALRRTR